jgi:hypothetical protein
VSPKRSPAEVPAPSAALPSQSQVISSTADLRQIFNGVPASTAPAINTTPPAATIPQAVITPKAAITPQAAPFVPTFRTATGSGIGNDGNPVSWSLNRTYFASKESAQWIANKYGAGQVIEVPFGGAGGPFSASANEYHIKLADGRTVNAGILAGYYERNPEDKFPGLAEKLIRNQLGV